MSITDDIRGYADTALDSALEQGRTALEQGRSALEQGRSAIELGRSTVEPYLAQAKQYREAITDRAEDLAGTVYSTVRNDKRVGFVLDTAETLGSVVVATLNERVVEPITSLTRRNASTTHRPATGSAPRKASTRPAAKSTAKKAPARKSAAKKPATTSTSASKPAAKRTTTATKSTAAKRSTTATKPTAAKKSTS